MILINVWALLRCLHALILEFLLHYLFCNLLYQALFSADSTNTMVGGGGSEALFFNFILRFFFWEESWSDASGKANVLKTVRQHYPESKMDL